MEKQTRNGLVVSIGCSDSEVGADIRDRRKESIEFFATLDAAQRNQLGEEAWSIGLRALSNAYADAQGAGLREIGRGLLDDIDGRLKAYVEAQSQTISGILSRYFDPKEGQVAQRLSAFVNDGGELSRLLNQYLAPQNSVLAETLAREVGTSSPLFRKLSITDSEGLVKVLEVQLQSVMSNGHTQLLRELDPLAKDGAVSRFLRDLQDRLRKAETDRDAQLRSALAALDPADEGSLINRLTRDTGRAASDLLRAINPDLPGSAMATIKQSLASILNEHAKSQKEATRQQAERQENFEKEVREALARLETKRSLNRTSPRGGHDFEASVVQFVASVVRGGPYLVEATGNTSGNRSRCKKGDLTVRFGPESAFEGATVVFEAKQDATVTPQRALEELDEARANRGAGVGVLVMSKSHALEGFPKFERHGNNVLVTWDAGDPGTDSYLEAAVLVGLGLASRGIRKADDGDIRALSDIEGRIEAELARLDRMTGHNETVRKGSDKIADEIRKATQEFEELLLRTRAVLTALKVEVSDETKERTTPVTLPGFGSQLRHPDSLDGEAPREQ